MNIFYNEKFLKNNLVSLTPSNKNVVTKTINDNLIFLDENNEVVGFNIVEANNKFKNLPEGRIYLTNELINDIQKEVGQYHLKDSEDGFYVAEIVECEDIKDTHLHKCIVRVGNKDLDIVCGAKNARKGLLTVVATVGTIMPSCLEIKPSKLKGFSSNGMLCSQKELCLEGYNSEGIIELDNTKYKSGDIFKPMYKNL